MTIFKGSGVALVTPFGKDGTVDFGKMEELLEFHCENHTDCIVVCGTTGEVSTLTGEEQLDVIRFAVQQVKGRIPVVAGTGANDTRHAVELSKEAEAAGVDGLLLVTPYYNKCTQEGLALHYEVIAHQVKLPIILYNVPGRTSVNLLPETAAELFRKVENIVGVKEASGNISQAVKLMNLTDGKIDLYSGNDDQIVPILSLGGRGVISVLANLAPEYVHEICEHYFSGNGEESCKMQLRALPLVENLFSEVNPIPVKTALRFLGMDCGVLRLPLTEMTEQNAKNLMVAMVEFGLPVRLVSREVMF